MTEIKLTWEEWWNHYKPIPNHLDKHESANPISMFETYGPELSHVKYVWHDNPNRVWTIKEEDGTTWIELGFHYVNRVGYYITEEPGNPDIHYIVDEHTIEEAKND